jgi:hypothetical protein
MAQGRVSKRIRNSLLRGPALAHAEYDCQPVSGGIMDCLVEQKNLPLQLSRIVSGLQRYFFDEVSKGTLETSFWNNYELTNTFEPIESLPLSESLLEYAAHHKTFPCLASHVNPVGCTVTYSYFSSGKKYVRMRMVNTTLLKSLVSKESLAISSPHFEYEVAFILGGGRSTYGLGLFNKAFDWLIE